MFQIVTVVIYPVLIRRQKPAKVLFVQCRDRADPALAHRHLKGSIVRGVLSLELKAHVDRRFGVYVSKTGKKACFAVLLCPWFYCGNCFYGQVRNSIPQIVCLPDCGDW